MNHCRKILFVGHNASRSGAPLLLLHFLRWLAKQRKFRFELLLLDGGPLVPEYRELCPVFDLNSAMRALSYRFRRRLGFGRGHLLARRFPRSKYPVIYVNSIAALGVGRELAADDRKLIIHVHELAYAFDAFSARGILTESIALNPTIIAVSGAVQSFLTKELQVPEKLIRLVYEFPISCAEQNGTWISPSENFRNTHTIDDDLPLIGMCGAVAWRKGPDLFILLARAIQEHLPDQFTCAWLGGTPQSHTELRYDLRRAGLEKVVRLIPEVADPRAFYESLDVFCLTSREDPFSVAMLEAAAAGVPVVCFQDAGGGPELVEDDAGISVSYLDVSSLAVACVKLCEKRALRQQLGNKAREKVMKRFSFEAHVRSVSEIVESALRSSTIPRQVKVTTASRLKEKKSLRHSVKVHGDAL